MLLDSSVLIHKTFKNILVGLVVGVVIIIPPVSLAAPGSGAASGSLGLQSRIRMVFGHSFTC